MAINSDARNRKRKRLICAINRKAPVRKQKLLTLSIH